MQAVIEFFAETPENRIVIGVLQKDPDVFGSAIVHLAWIQTWMTDTQRLDRAVYQFETDRSRIAVTLPSEADSVFLVRMDGREVKPEVSNQSVVVSLTPDETPRRHVLEVQYVCESRPTRGKMQV